MDKLVASLMPLLEKYQGHAQLENLLKLVSWKFRISLMVALLKWMIQDKILLQFLR